MSGQPPQRPPPPPLGPNELGRARGRAAPPSSPGPRPGPPPSSSGQMRPPPGLMGPPPPLLSSGPPRQRPPGPPLSQQQQQQRPGPPAQQGPSPTLRPPGTSPVGGHGQQPSPTGQRPGIPTAPHGHPPPPSPDQRRPGPPLDMHGGRATGRSAGALQSTTPTPPPTRGGAPPESPSKTGRAAFRSDHRAGADRGGDDLSTSGSTVSGLAASVSGLTLGNGSTATGGAPTNGSNMGGASSADSALMGRGGTRGGRDEPVQHYRTRPDHIASKKGTVGQVVPLTTNYFAMRQRPNWVLLQYRVDIAPEEDRINVKKAVVKSLFNVIGENIFDGTMMFSLRRMDVDPLVLTATKLPPRGAAEAPSVCTVTFKLTREVHPNDMSYVHVLNIILRKCMEAMNLEEIRRDYFDPVAAVDIPKWNLSVWPGYKTSIRQHESALLLCCDTTSKILRKDSVYVQIREVLNRSSNNKDAVFRALLGQIVMTSYNKKTYKIDNIDWTQSPSGTFPDKNGADIRYLDYYRNKYGVTIKDLAQPLLVSKPRDRFRRQEGQVETTVLLVPELCLMTGLSEEQRANFQLMKDLGEYTRAVPAKRTETLLRFANRIKTTEEVQTELSKWGVKFSEELVKVPGRLFPPEAILQGNPRLNCNYKSDNAEWSFGRGFKLLNMVPCMKWAVIYPVKDETDTQAFINILVTEAATLGFQLNKALPFKIANNLTASYVKELHKVIALKPDMVMVVVPNNKGDAYHAIKKLCCLESPIPSQVMTATVLRKPKGINSVASKVAVQMASKLGAEPWGVNIPLTKTMVIGYDSYHDTENVNKSIGAVVSTTNQTFTRFSSSVTIHTNNEELHSQMKQSIVKALRAYNASNNCLPERIIIYRDGVGDGQIQFVKETEIESIRSVLRENYQTMPKLCYIIVSKRINTRFFLSPSGRESINPQSGTVVDDTVTLPERYDFFLVSQSVRQGTVNPTSYNVILDESGILPNHIQQLTYKLCHLYYNWPGTVRVPSVCQYAHKLAFLVGNSLHKQPNAALEPLLYYL